MPLTALFNDQTIVSFEFKNSSDIKAKYPAHSLKCKHCGGDMYPRGGINLITHFAHYASDLPCSNRGESQEHYFGKIEIKRIQQTHYPESIIILEHKVWINKTENIYRIIDVYQEINGYRQAHELQLSPISVDDLKQRTEDYLSIEIEPTWYFSKVNIQNNAIKKYISDNNISARGVAFTYNK